MDPATVEVTAPKRPGLVSVDSRTYPLESVRLEGRAEGGIALSRLVQRFRNPHDEALEVVYTLPLPADGAVLGYVVRIGEKVVRGEIEPREKAEADYRRALYEGRTAGLLEQERADTFTQRLGNVPGKTDVEVSIEVLQPLAFLAGLDGEAPRWEYRFPTVVGVRYEGAPGRVGDAEKLDADRDATGGIPTRVELGMLIADATATAAGVVAHGHELVCEAGLDGTLVRFAEAQRLDRDIALRWSACTGEVGVRLVEGRGLAGDDGRYGLLTIVPPAAPKAAFRRDVTVLIDASGSMSGEPLRLAGRVVGELLRGLEPGDRFEILSFASDVRKLTSGLVDFDEKSLAAALAALSGLRAGGGTEMLRAVDEALRSLRDDAQRQVVLVTDGYIGFEGEVVGRVARRTQRGVRLHAVGIGAVPNRTLLHGIARAGRGVELWAGDETTADAAAKRLDAATTRPVLTDLVVEGGAVELCPTGAILDVFAGRPLVVPVEMSVAGGRVVVTGRLAGVGEQWQTTLDVPAAGATGGPVSTPLPIGALFGREVVTDLEAELFGHPRPDDLLQRIEQVALRHRIVSRRTSLVAIAEEPSVDPKLPRRRERLAVELPAGVSAAGVGLVPGYPAVFSADLMEMARPSMARWASGSRMLWAERPSVADGSEEVARGTPAPPTGPVVPWEEVHVRCVNAVREPDDTLVVEFEVPFDGLLLPDDAVYVVAGGGFFDKARVVRELGSPTGPHASGMIVRLALRLETEPAWPPAGAVALRWSAERPGGEPARARLVLDVRLPPVAGETPKS